jgi:putative FmdB family regulatory protein
MAKYVYRCEEGHEKEVVHSMKDDPEIVCDKCSGEMKRVPQSIIFGFKASDTLIEEQTKKFYDYKARKRGK